MADTSGGAGTSTLDMVVRQADFWRTRYRRVWKGSLTISFVEPVLFLLAMGVLLGRYVDAGSGGSGAAASGGVGSSYLAFIAPGLLAASAMQVATSETTWPVFGMIKWDRTYHAMLATPMRVKDVVAGHLAFVAFRLLLAGVVFGAVIACFGVFTSVPGALGAVLASVLTGMAFATPIYALAAGARSESVFGLVFRLGVVPLFLFSGAFFPISNLAEPLQWIARVLPLWHGVELSRGSAQGTLELLPSLGHAAYLVVMGGLGAVLAVRRLTRKMVA